MNGYIDLSYPENKPRIGTKQTQGQAGLTVVYSGQEKIYITDHMCECVLCFGL